MARLPPDNRKRLRAAVLALGRSQLLVEHLPLPPVDHILCLPLSD